MNGAGNLNKVVETVCVGNSVDECGGTVKFYPFQIIVRKKMIH